MLRHRALKRAPSNDVAKALRTRRGFADSVAYGGGAGGIEVTEWSVVADNKNMMYYLKMFESTNVQAFDLKRMEVNAKQIKYYDVNKPQTYISIN